MRVALCEVSYWVVRIIPGPWWWIPILFPGSNIFAIHFYVIHITEGFISIRLPTRGGPNRMEIYGNKMMIDEAWYLKSYRKIYECREMMPCKWLNYRTPHLHIPVGLNMAERRNGDGYVISDEISLVERNGR